MTDKLAKQLDISKNTLILACLTLILGFLIIISLIACIALGRIEIQGVKEFLGILGGALVSPSAIIFGRKIISNQSEKRKSKKKRG